MFSKQNRRISLIAIGLLLWLASVAYRNHNRPQVRRLSWEYDGPNCTVEYELWNPQDQPVYARTLTRIISDGSEDGVGVLFGAQREEVHRIAAKARLQVKQQLHGLSHGHPEVLVFLTAAPESRASAEAVTARLAASNQETGETGSGYHAAQRSPRGGTAH